MPSNFSPASLSGPNAFYLAPDYIYKTRTEMASKKNLKPIYQCTLENKVWRIAKLIFSIIIFPIGLCQLIHRLIGKLIVPASSPDFAKAAMGIDISADNLATIRTHFNLSDEWKIKRLSIEVDGHVIDAVIVGKESTLENGRWLLKSGGNGECYEQNLEGYELKNILNEFNTNAILFNYPGVGANGGLPSRNAMIKAYRAMLTFLEDQKKGIGAKEIIGYGHSIGGGVQAEALNHHRLKKDIKYVFVKDRTFSKLSAVPDCFLGFLSIITGWNMNCINSSLRLKAPEIIIQAKNDSIIKEKASLMKALESKKKQFLGPKHFIHIHGDHNNLLTHDTFDILKEKIEESFKDNTEATNPAIGTAA